MSEQSPNPAFAELIASAVPERSEIIARFKSVYEELEIEAHVSAGKEVSSDYEHMWIYTTGRHNARAEYSRTGVARRDNAYVLVPPLGTKEGLITVRLEPDMKQAVMYDAMLVLGSMEYLVFELRNKTAWAKITRK